LNGVPQNSPPLAARSPQANESSQADIEMLAELAILVREVLAERQAGSPQAGQSRLANYESFMPNSEPSLPNSETLDDEFAMFRDALARRTTQLKRPEQYSRKSRHDNLQ
jgi:hypothetical protein